LPAYIGRRRKTAPDALSEQSRGTGFGCRLAPGLVPDCSGRPSPPCGGAPGRAVQLLTSEGVCDAADTAVLTRLRELHPQAEGPNLEPTLPEDRPEVTPSWAFDQLLARGPVLPADSSDSAGEAGVLEALLTLVTATSSGRLQPQAAPYLCAARLIPPRKKGRGCAQSQWRNPAKSRGKMATGVRPWPECRHSPCPAPNGVCKGDPLRGRGHGSAGPGGRPSR